MRGTSTLYAAMMFEVKMAPFQRMHNFTIILCVSVCVCEILVCGCKVQVVKERKKERKKRTQKTAQRGDS
jgi:hypothetical protein